jgi:hypothetical protein
MMREMNILRVVGENGSVWYLFDGFLTESPFVL